MNKNLAAGKINDLINNYSDYIKTGFTQIHPEVNFNFDGALNPEIQTDVQTVKNETAKKPEFADIREKRKKIIELSDLILQCSNCELCKSSVKVTGIGNVNAEIFAVVEPPVNEDELSGRPLTGEIGLFVKKWFGSIDIDINDIFITNIIKCNPKKNKITKDIIEKCRVHLDNQIGLIEPRVILAMGQLAASSLKKERYDLMQNHGKVFNYNGYSVMPTFSPYAVLKDSQLKKFVWDDLKRLKKILQE